MVGRWLLSTLPVLALAFAVSRPLSAVAPAPLTREVAADGTRFGLSLARRRALFTELTREDGYWKKIAQRAFPDDLWAQADHWTDHMSQRARWMARERGLSITHILLAYDEGLHAGWRGSAGQRLRASFPPLATRGR